MLFNSFEFLLFFPFVTALFFILPHKFRWQLLLVASCFFYMFFKPEYILILFGTIIIDYIAGIRIHNAKTRAASRRWLIASIIANVGVLVFFKYYNFINTNITGIATWFGCKNHIPVLDIVLPIGLSFHTFQAMSYTIEVYRKNQQPERHLGIYALYVMFYPQLVAGPIERPQNILHQFYVKQQFSYENMAAGLRLIGWGMFKKVFIADRLSVYVGAVFDHPANHHGIQMLIAMLFFSVQIYCDFSGYSDIAIGCARCMGFNLMENFNKPYFSTGIAQFWTRWHISLSTWFRDYLYIPLGGNREGQFKLLRNILIVFLISGVWHGANWTYVVWGGLHGLFLIIGNVWNKVVKVNPLQESWLRNSIRMLFTLILVTFAWTFFRATSLHDAWYICAHSFDNFFVDVKHIITNENLLRTNLLYINLGSARFFLSVLSILFLFAMEKISGKDTVMTYIAGRNKIIRWSFYFLIVYATLLASESGQNQFIYFQF